MFLWITPLLAALSKREEVLLNKVAALSVSPLATAALYFRMWVLMADFELIFRALFTLFILILFKAVLLLAMVNTPFCSKSATFGFYHGATIKAS